MFSELLRSGFAFGFKLSQNGFGGRNLGFNNLRSRLGGSERGLEFSQAFLGGCHAIDNLRRVT